MVLARLSSKGQVVLPKTLREALHLQPGTQFDVRVVDGAILLQPLAADPVRALYGRYAGVDFLGELEAEHRHEVESDRSIRP